MSNPLEVTPDKESVSKYGYVEGGDGKLYRVARGGMNTRGQQLDDLYDKIQEIATKEGGDRSETYSTAREFFHLALSPFYNSDRIQGLLDDNCFVWSDVPDVIRVISGDDVLDFVKKKESLTES